MRVRVPSARASLRLTPEHPSGSHGPFPALPMNLRLAGALIAACLLVPSFARADTICYSETFLSSTTDWKQYASVQQFNPNLGTLLAIQIRVDCTMVASYRVESLDAAPAATAADMAFHWGLNDYSATTVLFGAAGATFHEVFTAFDGVIDFAGTSGAVHRNLTFVDSMQYTPALTPLSIAAFVGVGSTGFSLFATSATSITGPANLISQFTTSASMTIETCYTYAIDCNHNGVPDDVDLMMGAPDQYGPGTCMPDGVLDACQPEPDCDADGLPNRCNILQGEPDLYGPTACLPDGTPDKCQFMPDCDGDGLPDVCEPDTNGNGIPDDCDV